MFRSKNRRSRGIARIDQREKHNHGFFVRLQRKGIVHSAFFADKSYGGRRRAFRAAQKHFRGLEKKYQPMTRKRWAQLLRRRGRSGIIGVRRTIIRRRGKQGRVCWQANWSPRPHVVRRKSFSVRKFGERKARALAILTRRIGVQTMRD
jgi:AP2 domain